jgi:hypothetical protein
MGDATRDGSAPDPDANGNAFGVLVLAAIRLTIR